MKKLTIILLLFSCSFQETSDTTEEVLINPIVEIVQDKPVLTEVEEERITLLISELQSEDLETQHRAKYHLKKLGPKTIPNLVEVLPESSFDGRVQIGLILASFGQNSVEALISLLQNSNWHLIYIAEEALGDIGMKAKLAIEHLEKLTTHDNRNVRLSAISSLGKIGTEKAKLILKQISINGPESSKREALKWLKKGI